jgi:hypothetical protein
MKNLFLLVFATLQFTYLSEAMTLVKNGAPQAKIYVAPLPQPDPKARRGEPESGLATAVRELNYHLQKMSGASLEVVETTDAAQVKAPAIVLGELAVQLGATPQKTSVSQEGFRLLTKNNLLLIGGESSEGVLFGVDAVLNKLGCDWVMPGEIGEIIPQKKTIEIGDLDESQAPDFAMRRLWYRGYNAPRLPAEAARFEQWSRRQRAGRFVPVANETAGHSWDAFIKAHQAEFDKDPTMYALRRDRNGDLKRMGPQLESTHPRVIELMAQDIRDAFAKNNWPHDKAVGFPIGPADGLGYSLSVESQLAGSGRRDPIVGEEDRTDLLVLLANSIFEKLGAEYPNVLLGCYSYSVHADYPMKYKPNPRYVQIFAPINFSRFHAVTDEVSKTQAYYRGVVEQWGQLSREQGNPLIYRGYNWNLAENLMPYSKLHIWGEELPFYKAQNVIGLNVEATKQWGVLAPSDYVFMKLAWNSKLDWKQLLHEYCVKAYGAGAVPMEAYWLRLTETQRTGGQEAGSYWSFPLTYDEAFVAAAQRDLAEAKRLAKTDNDRTRIEYVASSVEALRLYLHYWNAANRFDFLAAKADYDAILAHWQKSYDLNTDIVANEAPAYLKRYIEQFITQGLKYSSGEYSIVERLPDAMPTIFDPNNVGFNLNYHRPEINDARFEKTKTSSSTWDAQGLTGLRTGGVWYRHHFTLPANLKGKPIGLFLGGMEDEARVYLNGKLIGSSGIAFSKPAAFDLTDEVIYDAENLLAIDVVRNGNANEIGLGGLLRPSFVFTGPRLETKAPKPFENRRVLPGGELGEIEQ